MNEYRLRTIFLAAAVLFLVSDCEESDTTPPEVVVTHPITGTTVSEIVEVKCEAIDNEEIDKVELFINGDSHGSPDFKSPYVFNWNTTESENRSTHTLVIRAHDVQGNSTDSDPISVTIDQTGAYPSLVNIVSIDYDIESMVISWEESPDPDFDRYELFMGLDTAILALQSVIKKQDSTSYSLADFDPFIETYFNIIVYDTLGLKMESSYLSNDLPAGPQAVNVSYVGYTLNEMNITWARYNPDLSRMQGIIQGLRKAGQFSAESDFVSYELLYSTSYYGEKTPVITITDIETTSYTISAFDPTQENWFWVEVTDYWGLSAVGRGRSNRVDSPPMVSEIYPVEVYNVTSVKWSPNEDEDFVSYTLYESTNEDMTGKSLIYTSETAEDTVFVLNEIIEDQIYYFQVVVTDHWGLESGSEIESMQKRSSFIENFSGSDYGLASGGMQTSDGGHILLGTIWFSGESNSEFWLLKTDANGTEVWSRTFGGPELDRGLSIEQTADDGFILTGKTRSYGNGANDVWLVKTDASGIEEWNQAFGGSNEDIGWSVQQTSDGGYIITGSTESFGSGDEDMWLIKTDAFGTEEWNQTFGGASEDWGRSVRQTADGGYIVAGATISQGNGYWDGWILKTDARGNEAWSHTFGGSLFDRLYSARQTADGGYVFAGDSQSFGLGNDDVWIFKTDAGGNQEWGHTFGTSNWESANLAIQTADGGYILTGEKASDILLLKMDAGGSEEWRQIIGWYTSDTAVCVQQVSDGSFVLIGNSSPYAALLIKTDASGFVDDGSN